LCRGENGAVQSEIHPSAEFWSVVLFTWPATSPCCCFFVTEPSQNKYRF
jgi:hypothetical protein